MSDQPNDRPPPPGAVPHYVPPQSTAPLPIDPRNPWGHGFQPQPAAPDLRGMVSRWHDVIKTAIAVVGALGTVAGLIFAAGLQAGAFRAAKDATSQRLDQQEQKLNAAVESSSKSNSTTTDIKLVVDELLRRQKNCTPGRRLAPSPVRRRDATDEQLPPGP